MPNGTVSMNSVSIQIDPTIHKLPVITAAVITVLNGSNGEQSSALVVREKYHW